MLNYYHFLNLFFKLLIHLFISLAVLGLCCCTQAALVVVSGHLIVVASLLGSSWALELHSATQWLVESS